MLSGDYFCTGVHKIEHITQKWYKLYWLFPA